MRCFARFLPAQLLSEAVANLERAEVDTAGATRPIPGAPELVAALPTGRYAFVTSAAQALADARWRGAGLAPPSAVVTAESVSRGKPDPEPFLAGAAALGVEPTRCLVFEDSPQGGEAARAAGAIVVAVGDLAWDFEPATRIADLTAVAVQLDGDIMVITVELG